MKNVIFLLLVLGACGVGGVKFYLPRLIDERINNRVDSTIADLRKQNNQLMELVKNLESRQQSLESLPLEHQITSDLKIDVDRWNCWCDLKDKLCQGSDYSEELVKFRKAFSDYEDLLKMVDSIVEDGSNSIKDNSLINNLLKFARIRDIDRNELDRISGYVLLLSVRKV